MEHHRYMSRDARKVVKHLGVYGIDVDSDNAELFQIELACSMFFPNHINGVIDKVLRGGNKLKKLEKAQEEGWHYFASPVTNMLLTRTSAAQPSAPDEVELDNWDPAYAAKVYRVVTSMLAHDMNRHEVNLLLVKIPQIATIDKIIDAIRICKTRNSRTISYLHGILERQSAETRAFLRERDKEQEDVWLPDDITDTISTDEAQSNWAHLSHTIRSMKALNAQTSGRRRRT